MQVQHGPGAHQAEPGPDREGHRLLLLQVGAVRAAARAPGLSSPAAVFLQEAAALHHADPPDGSEPEDRHYVHRTGPYPSALSDTVYLFTSGGSAGSVYFHLVLLDSGSDVRVGPDVVTDPAFLVTRWV